LIENCFGALDRMVAAKEKLTREKIYKQTTWVIFGEISIAIVIVVLFVYFKSKGKQEKKKNGDDFAVKKVEEKEQYFNYTIRHV
jgi:uncharacterized membrane protein affecting hemolysin expression